MSVLNTKPQAEPKRVKIGEAAELTPGTHKVVSVGDLQVAVFNIDGKLYAVDDRCPHRGAALSKGTRDECVVTCPLHHWQFDLQTGQCVGQSGPALRQFEVFRAGDSLLLDTSSIAEQTGAGIYRYLIRYGTMGWVGHFGSIEPIACAHTDRVVVQTRRGAEVGEVLAGPDEGRKIKDGARPIGEVLRKFTDQDERQYHQLRRMDCADLIEGSRQLLSKRQVGCEVIDCERLFDGGMVVLYFLGEASAELISIAEDLAAKWQVAVLFNSVIEPEVTLGEGAGAGGCGGGGGCCAEGGCGA